LNSSTDSILDSDKLDFSPVTDTVDPTSTITESLAHLLEFTASSDSFDYSSLKPSLPTSVIGEDMPLGSENSRYQSHFNKNAAFRNFNDTPHAPVGPSANNQTLFIHRQTLISEWIGQMPAVLDDYLL